jgi:hypothetical protein
MGDGGALRFRWFSLVFAIYGDENGHERGDDGRKPLAMQAGNGLAPRGFSGRQGPSVKVAGARFGNQCQARALFPARSQPRPRCASRVAPDMLRQSDKLIGAA